MTASTRYPTAAIRALIALGTALVIGALGLAIQAKEHIKRDGEIVYLELAPVDPRSLIQGDYMALRFALANALERGTDHRSRALREGEVAFAPVTLDARHVAHLASGDAAPSMKLRYRIRDARVWLGTNAFFFEEGSARRYGDARYGEFRVDRATGEAMLVTLRGATLEPL